jgi:D-alanyl-lipoteichoic acid acyltransferase DltB (MBOAT superfamily)
VLFVSAEFIFVFLPVFLAGYFALGRIAGAQTAWFVAVASLAFYAWWDRPQLAILLLSVSVNFAVYRWMRAAESERTALRALIAGLAFNLGLLGYFKYGNFLASIVAPTTGAAVDPHSAWLPLGISFFTFTQIMFLVDVHRERHREVSFRDFLAFVAFFPHLIAGPLLHHRRIVPQLMRDETYRWCSGAVAAGLTLFVIGFFKKTVIADSLAAHADLVFTAADRGVAVPAAAAWSGALSYTFQLYFDFSAYCDMALGLARMINIRMPINFFSPYKATSIRDFWRRWHITLSFFLRNYLYIPLGGNRGRGLRRYGNLFVTMLLGGIWHGAGWTFVLWGALHGLYLVINHVWRDLGLRLPPLAGWALTFLAVVAAWVVFRAGTLSGATGLLGAMSGLKAAPVSPDSLALLPGLRDLAWIASAAFVAFVLPNAMQFTWLYRPGLNIARARLRNDFGAALLLWRPTLPWALAISVLALAGFVVAFNRQVDVKFLYFQF